MEIFNTSVNEASLNETGTVFWQVQLQTAACPAFVCIHLCCAGPYSVTGTHRRTSGRMHLLCSPKSAYRAKSCLHESCFTSCREWKKTWTKSGTEAGSRSQPLFSPLGQEGKIAAELPQAAEDLRRSWGSAPNPGSTSHLYEAARTGDGHWCEGPCTAHRLRVEGTHTQNHVLHLIRGIRQCVILC